MKSSLVGVIGVVAVLLFGAFANAVDSQDKEKDVQVVEVTAERFSFTPSEVRTTVGKTLEFRLRSDDTNHGFRILDTDINVRIPKRGKGAEIVTFTPDKPGRYTFECSKLCGAGHSFMRGVIIVAEPEPAPEPKPKSERERGQ